MSKMDQHVSDLIDFLVASPEDVTIHEIADALQLSVRQAQGVVRSTRLWFEVSDTINLVCHPNGRGPWLYSLVGDPTSTKEWSDRRVSHVDTELETIHAMLTTTVRNTDGRTIEGRKARIMERAVRRMLEDLADLDLDA